MKFSTMPCLVAMLVTGAPVSAATILDIDERFVFRGESFAIMGSPPTHVLTIRHSNVVASMDFNSWMSGTTKAARLALHWVGIGSAVANVDGASIPTSRAGGVPGMDRAGPPISLGAAAASPLRAGLPGSSPWFGGAAGTSDAPPPEGFPAGYAALRSAIALVVIPVTPHPVISVPEPGTFALLGTALLGLAAARSRKPG